MLADAMDMSNESKRLKEGNDFTLSTNGIDKSLLPDDVLEILFDGMYNGFSANDLKLSERFDYTLVVFYCSFSFSNLLTYDLIHRQIDDGMIPDLCEWIFKLGNKVKNIG